MGRPPAALPRGTWREVVRGEFALVNDAQYTVDLFSVSHCTGHLLRADGDSREDALLWVPRQYTSTCSWPWNYQTGAASTPFRTKRIHIGMDEAWNLGRGKYIDEFGLEPPLSIMKKHLSRVMEIVRELAQKKGITTDIQKLEIDAEAFALRRGHRSARCAEQFIDSLL